MKNNSKISVCMTVFSNSKYLEDQIESICFQTLKIDELVVYEDHSGDKSPRLYIEKILYKNKINLIYKVSEINLGPAESFRKAIALSSGDIIFLSDQDDIWDKDRVKEVIKYHEVNDLVIVNGKKFYKDDIKDISFASNYQSIYQQLNISILSLIKKNKVVGATMSFNGNLARFLASKIPFYPMHDWILTISFLVLNRRIKFINKDLILYRRHDKTFTENSHNSFLKKITFRLFILFRIIKLFMIKYSNHS